jgi:predicted Zn-dependent protease with MMP-like domain
MIEIDDEEFEKIINKSIEGLPKIYQENLKDVAFIVEDVPSLEQRQRMNLGPNQSLFGLYEGVPLSRRMGTVKTLPDKITIYKKVIEMTSNTKAELYDRVGRTIWHEVAHYYGLDHQKIKELEDKESS